MPISYNGGTANFAALMPYQNFAQKAAYKQQDALYLNEINKIEDEKMARVNEMQKNIADNAAALAAMPVEPQDVARLRSEIETKTADALKEMRSSGDPESWLRNNGKIVGTDLTRKVLTGDVLTNMSVNKASMAKINDDLANGRRIRPIDVTLADGTVTKLDSKAAIDKWRNGEITRIQYDSGYDVPDVGKVMAFAATNDNPDYFNVKNKEQVTFLQYKNLLSRDIAAKNMSEKELDDYAKETYNPAFKWNNNNVRYQQQSLQEQRANRQQSRAASGGSIDNLYNQSFVRPFNSLTEQFVKNGGVDIPPAISTNANAMTRIISGNDQIGKGIIPINAQKEGVYAYNYATNKYNAIVGGPNNSFNFEPDGSMGYMGERYSSQNPGKLDKDGKQVRGSNNGMAGGSLIIPVKRIVGTETTTLTRDDVAKQMLESFGINPNPKTIYEDLGSYGIGVSKTPEKIDGEMQYRVTGISTGIIPHRDFNEYQNRVNVTGGNKQQEGIK